MTKQNVTTWVLAVFVVGVATLRSVILLADDPRADSPKETKPPAIDAPAQGDGSTKQKENKSAKTPPGLTRLADGLWVDPMRKYVVVDGKVSMRDGPLEMFACPKGTKEHESIVAINCRPQYVHAALNAVGAIEGKPVKFDPKYVPASGTEIDIWILWKDRGGMKRSMRAQNWVRNADTRKALNHKWVFAGSGFWVDEESGKRHYKADAGDFICVSNFTTATLDLTIESSASMDDLLYEAFTENIPNRGTHVRLVLIPKLETKKKKDSD